MPNFCDKIVYFCPKINHKMYICQQKHTILCISVSSIFVGLCLILDGSSEISAHVNSDLGF
mgnify:CR=1 FL=1